VSALTTLTSKLAATLNMGDGAGLIETLKATAFKGQVSDAQMTALMVVANQYGLNPWTKEIYAFPDQNNGIVPVVGVDGWARIINSHDQFDGMDFIQDDESCTCVIYRKDRSHPIKVTEWMAECKRPVKPWQSHPKRMLRHKAMIQCARLAFGYAGIYDQDEAERITDADKVIDAETGEIVRFDVNAAVAEAKVAATLEQLNAVWKARGSEAVNAKDKTGHAALKSAVLERKAELEKAATQEQATDVQPKEGGAA
jgi:phage recombination protein Bet